MKNVCKTPTVLHLNKSSVQVDPHFKYLPYLFSYKASDFYTNPH